MRRSKRFWVGTTALVLLGMGCDWGKKDPVETEQAPKARMEAPAFLKDSAYAFVAEQVAFGPRVPNTEAHRLAGDWLIQELNRHGAEVTVQAGRVKAYDGTWLNIRNIIGSYRPEAQERILLYAHWDTRPFADKDSVRTREPILGANDGGSGVGVLLEIARLLKSQPARVGVDIIFFDAEDYGRPEWDRLSADAQSYREWCLGSQFWAQQPHRFGYRAKYGILLDMVGGKNAVFNKEGTSMEYAPHVVEKIWTAARGLGYGQLFQNEVTPQTVDDNLFVSELAGIPSANIVHYELQVRAMGYGAFHHTHQDNMDIIDPATLEAVGRVLADVVWNE
jgi:glutaminyl-peptide cyclotransferase